MYGTIHRQSIKWHNSLKRKQPTFRRDDKTRVYLRILDDINSEYNVNLIVLMHKLREVSYGLWILEIMNAVDFRYCEGGATEGRSGFSIFLDVTQKIFY